MTILENYEDTQHVCRFVSGVECVILLYNDAPTDEKNLIETCKACAIMHVAVELRRLSDVKEEGKK